MKTLRMFQCFDSYIKFFFAFIIKNHMMKRLKNVETNLFKNLFDEVKMFFFLNCWFVLNRQSYLSIIVFFIDKNWKYHEVLIEFEYMKEKHTNETLTKVVKKILTRHNIQTRILIYTIDNVSNNIIFFLILIKNLNIITSCVNVIFEKNDEEDDEMSDKKKRNIVHVSCFTYVLQLTLQTFLDSIKINSINDELQKNWNDQENIRAINQAIKEMFMTLTKIIFFKNICNNLCNNLASFDRICINFIKLLNSKNKCVYQCERKSKRKLFQVSTQ
jgi:hypothetical protein